MPSVIIRQTICCTCVIFRTWNAYPKLCAFLLEYMVTMQLVDWLDFNNTFHWTCSLFIHWYSLYGNVVPLVNYHFLYLTPVQTETSFGVSLFAKHRLLSQSGHVKLSRCGRGLSASLKVPLFFSQIRNCRAVPAGTETKCRSEDV